MSHYILVSVCKRKKEDVYSIFFLATIFQLIRVTFFYSSITYEDSEVNELCYNCR